MSAFAGTGCIAATSGAVKLSACFRRMISGLLPNSRLHSQTPLDPIWEKVGRVEVGKLVAVSERNCLPSPNHHLDCLVKGDKFVVCIELFGREL